MPTEEQVIATLAGTADEVNSVGQNIPADVTPPPAVASQEDTPPPANNEPPKEETPPPATAQPAFNLDEELVRSTGGAVKSKDELVALAERANKATEFETRAQQLERERDELKAKTEVNPFANDYINKLNALYKAGANESQIQAFTMLNKVPDLNTLSPLQASSLALQVKHGLSESDANIYLSNKYGVDVNDPEAQLDPTAAIQLKIDSAADRDFLNTQKAVVSAPPANESERQQQQFEAQNLQRLQQVEPMAKQVTSDVIANAFKAFSINGKDGDAAVKIDLPIAPENVAALNEAVNNYIKNYDIQPNDDGKKKVESFVTNSMWIQNGKQWVIEAANQREKMVRAEYNNPTGNPPRGEDNPDKGKTQAQTREEGIRRAVLDY